MNKMLPGFHDAKISSIKLEENNLLSIKTLHREAEKYINIEGLVKLRISDFEEGNIISRIYSYSGESGQQHKEEIMNCLIYAYKLTGEILKKHPDQKLFIDEKCKEVIKGNLIVLEIEPAYGCYLVAIGKSIKA